jgi:hypothetical protein
MKYTVAEHKLFLQECEEQEFSARQAAWEEHQREAAEIAAYYAAEDEAAMEALWQKVAA